MAARRQIAIFAALSFVATTLAAFGYAHDWRPALAVGLFQAVLLRIALALKGAAPRLGTVAVEDRRAVLAR